MSTVNHGFIITRDHLDHTTRRLVGPRNTVRTADEIIAHGVPFRLKDADDNLCFEGMYLGGQDENMFSPLDDFGEGVAGCTTIQYRDHTKPGTWADL